MLSNIFPSCYSPRIQLVQIAWETNGASPAEVGGTLAAVDETITLAEVSRAMG